MAGSFPSQIRFDIVMEPLPLLAGPDLVRADLVAPHEKPPLSPDQVEPTCRPGEQILGAMHRDHLDVERDEVLETIRSNVALRLRFHVTQRLEPDRAAWLLAFDIAELAVLLFLTGGLQNPFAFLFLGPVLLSATALPPRFTLILGGFAVVCSTVLVFVHYPLPWDIDDPLQLPPIYMIGVWLCILLAIGFIGVYAWQITEESRQLSDALAATDKHKGSDPKDTAPPTPEMLAAAVAK